MIRFVVLLLALGMTSFGIALADDGSSILYEINQVSVDITAKNSAQARDLAINEAQKRAFDELLIRLGVNPAFAAHATPADIAPLVQNFEVENEKSSSVRYLGVFTVRFKQSAVRALFDNFHVKYTESRSKPYLVLALYSGNDPAILWEEPTQWLAVWDQSPKDKGLVPIIVLKGNLDDIGKVTTDDLLQGNYAPVRDLIEKYHAGGAVIVNLKTNIDHLGSEMSVDIERLSDESLPAGSELVTIKIPDGKPQPDQLLGQMVRECRSVIDHDWRQGLFKGDVNAIASFPRASSSLTLSAVPSHMAMNVLINDLADWALVKRKLDTVPTILHTTVLSLQRDTASIDLEFRGNFEALQQDLTRQGLQLTQDSPTGFWLLQRIPTPD